MPLTDIGYFLGTGIGDALRRAHEDELLELYCAEMTARGVPLSRDAVWDDYVVGALHGISTAVFSAAYVERTPRGDENFLSMARGGCALALQHGSLELFEGMSNARNPYSGVAPAQAGAYPGLAVWPMVW